MHTFIETAIDELTGTFLVDGVLTYFSSRHRVARRLRELDLLANRVLDVRSQPNSFTCP
jgi:hypothetical protein